MISDPRQHTVRERVQRGGDFAQAMLGKIPEGYVRRVAAACLNPELGDYERQWLLLAVYGPEYFRDIFKQWRSRADVTEEDLFSTALPSQAELRGILARADVVLPSGVGERLMKIYLERERPEDAARRASRSPGL